MKLSTLSKQITFFCIMIFMFSSCGDIFHEKTEDELKQELAEKEKQNSPSKYLVIETGAATMSEDYTKVKIEDNLFADDKYENRHNYYYVVGTMKNISMQTKYKDVKLLLRYNSSTGSEMQTEEVIVYDFLEPNSTKTFRVKVKPSLEWYEQSGHTWSVGIIDAILPCWVRNLWLRLSH